MHQSGFSPLMFTSSPERMVSYPFAEHKFPNKLAQRSSVAILAQELSNTFCLTVAWPFSRQP